jgi:tetratricopeptide (TPR) repeat protein
MHKTTAKQQSTFIYLALVIITLTVFWQTHRFKFTNYDDDKYVSENIHISTGLKWNNIAWVLTNEHVGNWHPLTGLSHMLDCQLFGLNSGRHHLVNLLFHIANTLLLFIVLKQITGAAWKSAFVSTLFAIHPLHVESVAWIAERKDVLSAFFWILTMVAYSRYVKNPKVGRYILTIVLFALGLMSKPMVVTLPFVLLLLDYWPLNRLDVRNRRQIYNLFVEKTPFFVLSAASSIITFLVQRSAGAMDTTHHLPLMSRLANAVVSYMLYTVKMVWPTRLAVFYPHPGNKLPHWQVVVAGVSLAAITICVICFAAKHKYLLVGWFWYLGTLVPVIGLVQVGAQAMADRYTYIPLIGLFIIAGWGAEDLLQNWKYRRIALAILSAAIISISSVCTFVQTSYWYDSRTLFEHALKVTTGNYIACDHLALALVGQNKPEEAIDLFHLALQFDPGYAEAYCNLGGAYGKLGRYTEQIEACKKAIKIKPDYAQAYSNLGAAYGQLGRYEEEMEACKKAVQIEPNLASAYYNLGIACGNLKRYQEAIEAYKQVVRIKPDDSQAYCNLGDTYGILNRVHDAIEVYKQAVRIKPDYARARFGLGLAYFFAGDTKAAAEQHEILKALNPKLADQLAKVIYK